MTTEAEEQAPQRFPDTVIDILTKPLPPEAIKEGNAATKWLSSIKSIYVTERLNEAFGYGRWQISDEPIMSTEAGIRTVIDKNTGDVQERYVNSMVVIKAHLKLLDYPWFAASSYGGNDNPDLGDAYKGAVTDAISKMCAMYLGIAQDVFKGLPPERGPRITEEQRQANAQAKIAAIKKEMETPPKTLQELRKPALTQQLEDSLAEENPPNNDVEAGGKLAINPKQIGLFAMKCKKSGKSLEEIKAAVHAAGLTSIKNCPWDKKKAIFDDLLSWADMPTKKEPEPITITDDDILN